MRKSKVFLIALAICLIAILSMGTLAWFNATDDITNNFMVAVDGNDTNPEFTVTVTETDLNGIESEAGNDYYKVLPGDVIEKDPKITNTGDYTQWIRVSVTMTKAAAWKANGGSLVFSKVFSGSTYGMAADVATATETWLLSKEEAILDAEGNGVWYLYLNDELDAGETVELFNQVKIEEDFDLDEVLAMGGEFSVTVKAEAVQRDNTGDNAVEAFETVQWDEGAAFVDSDVA